jgi:hypothetical protein
MNTTSAPTRHVSGWARGIAATIAAFAIALLAPAAEANATVSNASGTLSAGASCYRYDHKVQLGATLALSTRFPRGAYVAVRYEYWYVDQYLRPTSPAYATGWQYTNVGPSSFTSNGINYVGFAYNLPGYTLSTWGHLFIGAQVGVWNGSYYEYSNWDVPTRYDTYGQFGIYSNNNVCLASVT